MACVCLLLASKTRQCNHFSLELLCWYTDNSVSPQSLRVSLLQLFKIHHACTFFFLHLNFLRINKDPLLLNIFLKKLCQFFMSSHCLIIGYLPSSFEPSSSTSRKRTEKVQVQVEVNFLLEVPCTLKETFIHIRNRERTNMQPYESFRIISQVPPPLIVSQVDLLQ